MTILSLFALFPSLSRVVPIRHRALPFLRPFLPRCRHTLASPSNGTTLSLRSPAPVRAYHGVLEEDKKQGFSGDAGGVFGYTSAPPRWTPAVPDYTPIELANRNANATLLRYVDNVRRHGHRAALIDPLDIMERDPVAALSPTRYGLERAAVYPLRGIMDHPAFPASPRVSGAPTSALYPGQFPSDGDEKETKTAEGSEGDLTLDEIEKHLMGVYVGRIGYEFMHSSSKAVRSWFCALLESLPDPSSTASSTGQHKDKRGQGPTPTTPPPSDPPQHMPASLRAVLSQLQPSAANSEWGPSGAGEDRGPLGRLDLRPSPSPSAPATEAKPGFSPGHDEKRRMWELLAKSEVFDWFLQAKFPNLKRYGLEGAESMLPALDTLFGASARANISNIVLCMPHRGRLSLLTDLLRYDPANLFHKVKGGPEVSPDEFVGSEGDVLSHLISCPSLKYEGADEPVKISMLPNPSHLEAVNPVAQGKARAKQADLLRPRRLGSAPPCPEDRRERLGDDVLCVQLHGDAAFTGQGVVMESLGLSDLPHYTIGGSVHIVVNNNIGYTTPSTAGRSSLYCSDIAKMINAPVLHVNGDYPEGERRLLHVARAIAVAFEYRQQFRKDVFVDLVVYRRWGHNELDEPAFTQPLMYDKIRARKSVPEMYEEKLLSDGVLSSSEASAFRESYRAHLDERLKAAQGVSPRPDLFGGNWKDVVWPASEEADHDPETGVEEEILLIEGKRSVLVPDGFKLHPRLHRHISQRLASLSSSSPSPSSEFKSAYPREISFATAEALAMGTLLAEGFDVRISGQDVGRGTFSQRHAILVDQTSERALVPLNSVANGEERQGRTRGRLELANSFELGMSWESPNLLPMMEHQFADFSNGAQVIIDTFLSSGEAKWLKQSGLVMLLPHGLEGGGPEHSSGRMERFLQLTNDRGSMTPTDGSFHTNMTIANPSTPAQYFHLLRRQMKRNYRRPLVVLSPKGLLRSPAATSRLEEMGRGARFKSVLEEGEDCMKSDEDVGQGEEAPLVARIVFCTGRHYYSLASHRDSLPASHPARSGPNDDGQGRGGVALIRLEELAPFPFCAVSRVLRRHARSLERGAEVVWAQEEARNQGAWGHVKGRLESVLEALLEEVEAGKKKRSGRRGNEGRAKRARVRYIGRKESAIPATGFGHRYKEEQEQIVRDIFEGL